MVFNRTKNNIFLAPMAGVTDAAFRQLAIEQGAGLTYTEMVSAKGLKYGSSKTSLLTDPAPNENVFGVQLFSSDTEAVTQSIEWLFGKYPDRILLFDINMGCPAPKITANGEGCALMNDMPLASKIIRAAVKASKLPVTVKFRKGWDESSINAVDFARMAEDSGASAVTVHGRTRQQFYKGKSDNQIIEKVKKAICIPVVGNGDIFSAKDAVTMFENTGCDAIMVARGALGNPFLFREILYLMATGREPAKATSEEKAAALFRQAKLCIEAKGERIAMRQIRKHAAWYLKGMQNATKLREAAVRLETLKDLKKLLNNSFEHLDRQ
ncbi:MAG: tRNA dihydrouridine synthase DusB [Christensenellales bacterium]|jgi:tRNA-dihydrouridine synthase B